MDLEEFYVASNPPLSPSGVEEVVASLRELNPTIFGNIYEVIYDPEVPWFRFLVGGNLRGEIVDFLKGTLESMGEMDALAVDRDNQSSSNGDVATRDQSRLIPWSAEMSAAELQLYGHYRFPSLANSSDPSEPQFKAIWHGIEEAWPKFTSIANLFEQINATTPNSQSSLEVLQERFDVMISFDARQTLLYIGSYHSMDAINRTMGVLDRMVQRISNGNLTQVNNHILPVVETQFW